MDRLTAKVFGSIITQQRHLREQQIAQLKITHRALEAQRMQLKVFANTMLLAFGAQRQEVRGELFKQMLEEFDTCGNSDIIDTEISKLESAEDQAAAKLARFAQSLEQEATD